MWFRLRSVSCNVRTTLLELATYGGLCTAIIWLTCCSSLGEQVILFCFLACWPFATEKALGVARPAENLAPLSVYVMRKRQDKGYSNITGCGYLTGHCLSWRKKHLASNLIPSNLPLHFQVHFNYQVVQNDWCQSVLTRYPAVRLIPGCHELVQGLFRSA